MIIRFFLKTSVKRLHRISRQLPRKIWVKKVVDASGICDKIIRLILDWTEEKLIDWVNRGIISYTAPLSSFKYFKDLSSSEVEFGFNMNSSSFFFRTEKWTFYYPNPNLIVVIYITREIKPSFYYPCLPVENNLAALGFLQVSADKIL